MIVQEYLNDCRSFYSCIYCRTHLANHDELVSRSFQGNRSRAYLFNAVVNISTGPPVQRELNTGSHAVADIFCSNCGTTIGWKYERAYVDSQKYKEGKFIIELAHVVRENRHLELDKRDMFLSMLAKQAPTGPSMSTTAKTIGTSHSGSVSPTSGAAGSWSSDSGFASSSSSASSSASSPPQSSSSSSSSTSPRAGPVPSCQHNGVSSNPTGATATAQGRTPARQRYHSATNYELDQVEGQLFEDIDHEEVLMFPFYDDLYGNRSSYHSSSSIPLSFQRRFHRSLYLTESQPYDWKYARSRATSASYNCGSNVSNKGSAATRASDARAAVVAKTLAVASSLETPDSKVENQRAPVVTSSIDIPTTSSASLRQVACSSSSSENDHAADDDAPHAMRTSEDDSDETQFKLEEECGGGSSSAAYSTGPTGNNSSIEQTCDSSARDRPQPIDQSHSSGLVRKGTSISSNNSTAATGVLSLDDEEFYDCCTDHDVSNSPSTLRGPRK